MLPKTSLSRVGKRLRFDRNNRTLPSYLNKFNLVASEALEREICLVNAKAVIAMIP